MEWTLTKWQVKRHEAINNVQNMSIKPGRSMNDLCMFVEHSVLLDDTHQLSEMSRMSVLTMKIKRSFQIFNPVGLGGTWTSRKRAQRQLGRMNGLCQAYQFSKVWVGRVLCVEDLYGCCS